MRVDRVDNNVYYIAETLEDLTNWEIAGIQQHKEGVQQLHLVREILGGYEFLIMFCSNNVLDEYFLQDAK
jgi:hypothetical protein